MTEIGMVYGDALYALAKDEGICDSISDQLRLLQEAFHQEPDFVQLLSAPNLTKTEKCQVLDDSFRGKLQPYLLNFLKILTEKGYMRHFSNCCDAYMLRYNQDNGILSVTAVTAVALSPEQTETLTEKLHHITGKRINLMNRIDSQCLGGVRLDYDGKRLDDTLSHRLQNIHKLLKTNVL